MEDWEAGRRTPPEYIPRLLAYQIKFEGIFAEKKKTDDYIEVDIDVIELEGTAVESKATTMSGG